jgi:6-phosphogluconolactonase
MERIVLEGPLQIATTAADIVQGEVESSDGLMLGLAGGSTPRATHEILAGRDLDWSRTTAWLTDERWVRPDDPEANQRMARESLVDRVGVEFLAPDTTTRNPADVARIYADLVVPMLTDGSRRSVAMLGMGADGHTASLFPGTRALEVTAPSYVANFVTALDTWRLTSTFALLDTADVVLFLVSGESKAEALAAIAAGADLPAGRVTARERVLWIVDEAAASLLRGDDVRDRPNGTH